MKTKTIKFDIPNGYVVDLDNSDFSSGTITLKSGSEELTWEEFGTVSGYYIDTEDEDGRGDLKFYVSEESDKHNKDIYPNYELAEAALALCQLLQWRNKVWEENDNWKPNWKSSKIQKYCISINKDEIVFETLVSSNRILCFPNRDLAEKFLKQHKTLIEKAKDLL